MINSIKINNILVKKSNTGSYFTTIPAEYYDVGKNHFTPIYRSIFVSSEMYKGTNNSFFYITSDIIGIYRGYKCRNSYEMAIGNIFSSDKTLQGAISKFEYNLKNKIYNRS